MGEMYLLRKGNIASWLQILQSRARVIAPVRRAGELRFDYMGDQDQVELGDHNTRRSPKWVFFPQVERMLRYGQKLDDYSQVLATPMDETPQVLLGVRPCDARSFVMLDRVFGQGTFLDPYYLAKRNHTLVVAMACVTPTSTCFCQAFGSGPADTSGADIILHPTLDAYLAEAISERGAEELRYWQLPLADAGSIAQAKAIEAEAEQRLRPMDPIAGIENELPRLWDSTLWRDVSEKCIACGTCTYNCPECHCFNIEDSQLASDGERLRGWDACMFSQFTQHASGHNPRPDQASRWRQRVNHKFEYLPHNIGLFGCVGCGRCIVSCPVRLDIRQVLQRVRMEALTQVETAAGKGAK
jgi:sulfhydrogenase subunit beta (sulfur reductase)